MGYLKKLAGDICYLSPVDASEADIVAKWSNDMDVALRTGDISDMITIDVQRNYLEHMTSARGYGFYIVRQEDDRAVGIVRLMRINLIGRNAVLGIFIGERNDRSRGIGSEAIKLILDFGFNVLNLRNIMLETYSFNEPAIKAFKKCGFQEIGRRRKAIIYGTHEYDEVFMDILNDEFEDSIINKILDK